MKLSFSILRRQNPDDSISTNPDEERDFAPDAKDLFLAIEVISSVQIT